MENKPEEYQGAYVDAPVQPYLSFEQMIALYPVFMIPIDITDDTIVGSADEN